MKINEIRTNITIATEKLTQFTPSTRHSSGISFNSIFGQFEGQSIQLHAGIFWKYYLLTTYSEILCT